jgi:hypothetical protein
MAETFKSGGFGITVQQDRVRRLLDQTTEGAASGFIREADAALADVQKGAVARWPVHTGRSIKAFERKTSIHADQIAVSLSNTATDKGFPYPRFLKFSVFTEATVNRDLAERERLVARADTPEAKKAVGDWYDKTRRLTTSKGSPDEASAGKRAWTRLVRTPGRKRGQTLIEAVRADLLRLAGGS